MIEIENWVELKDISDEAKHYLLKQLYANTLLWNELVRHFKKYIVHEDKVIFTYSSILAFIKYVKNNYALGEDVSLDIMKDTVKRFYYTMSYLFTSNTIESKSPILFKDNVSIYNPLYISKESFVFSGIDGIDGILYLNNISIYLPADMVVPVEHTGLKLHYVVDEENKTETFSLTFI